jgi:hypothetical protein
VNRRKAVGIAVGALALVATAWTLSHARDMTPERERGSAALPGLEAKAADVAAVEVLRGNGTVRLERTPSGGWSLVTNDGYPARPELVRALLVSVAGLAVDDRMTAKKERHGELGLAWPDASGKARLVRFLPAAAGAPPVAEIVLGEERFSPDAVFVRLPAQDQTWRALGRVQVPADAMGWLDRTLVTLPANETLSASFDGVTATPPAAGADPQPGQPRMSWFVKVSDEAKEQWETAQIDSATTGLPSFLERLEFEGVRKARTDRVPEPAWSPSFETKSATVTVNGRKEADGTWFTLTIVPKPGAPAPEPRKHEGDPFVPDWTKLAAATAGWEFRMPEWKADTLRRMRAPAPKADAPTPVPPAGLAK